MIAQQELQKIMMTTCIEHPKDPVCQQELEHIAACGLDWNAFSHKTILVTGATGLVGSYAVRALAAINRIHNCWHDHSGHGAQR